MDYELNDKIIAHITGLTEDSKKDLYLILKKSKYLNNINIIDIDTITIKIIEDNNMEILFTKYEYYNELSKNKNLGLNNNKNALIKAKNFEKKMFQYWKVKTEYYLNKICNTSKNKIIIVGYLSFFKNHKININLNIITKFFLKVNYENHAKSIISSNIENSKNDIINGNFDLNYLDINFLVKKRIQLQLIYTKLNYIIMSLSMIVTTIELYINTIIPEKLYFASFHKYDKKIPILVNSIQTYTNEWLALSSILDNSIKKNEKDGKLFLYLTKIQYEKMSNNGYIYEITSIEDFLPFPNKNNIYKYFTIKSIKFNRFLIINNIIDQLKKLNVNIINID